MLFQLFTGTQLVKIRFCRNRWEFVPVTDHVYDKPYDNPKTPLAFFFALFLLLAIAVAAPVNPARADNLSQGLELYQQKKFREATPYLEKAAQEGHEEAIGRPGCHLCR